MTDDGSVLYEKKDGIAYLTINRPERMNSLPAKAWSEGLARLWKDVDTDPKVRVAIFGAVGDKAFCAGVDVKEQAERRSRPPDEQEQPGRMMATAYQNNVSKPVITAVNGICGGGGLMFVSDCDIAIASPKATFFNPGVTVGIVALVGQATWTRWVPFQSMMRMALMGAGERMSAQRAYELGMVTELVEDKPVEERAVELADTMKSNSPTAMRIAKKVLWDMLDEGSLSNLYDRQHELVKDFQGHPDSKEGPKAFAEKRKPRWLEG